MKLEFTVGKYTLESLTNGMYASPLDLYREYVQNCVDSIDEAKILKLENENSFKIEIIVDSSEKSISIIDNGCGIKKDYAVKTLLDIGNSNKRRSKSRGFRGIGRLAGLGYCSKLSFVTSSVGEAIKTEIVFDTKKLKSLMLSTSGESTSIQDVIEEIVTIKTLQEKVKKHYFEVKLEEVDMDDKLLGYDIVKDYLIQNCPLPFSPSFKWGSLIKSKLASYGCKSDEYCVILNIDGKKEQLYKAYENTLVSDIVKKFEDNIQDITVNPFYRDDKICAVLWIAQTNYLGTVLDNTIKGIRIRQGNIQIGGKSTFNQFFKEERFNGWLIGELHIMDTELIINSRRDDIEKNLVFYDMVEEFKKWSLELSKNIRKKSYERSLSNEKKKMLETEEFDDENSLGIEDFDLSFEVDEASSIDLSDLEFVAESDFYNKLSMILNSKKAQTKYSALNINDKLTIEQRKILERVFDIITLEFDDKDSEKFINTIAKEY